MIGIYKITNNINGHGYIGLSTNIEKRWRAHKDPYNWRRQSNKILYQAFSKYGIQNFSFEVLEQCGVQQLSDKEQYYIAKYNTLKDGYNATTGGQSNSGESHPGHKLTKQDIIDIRIRYDNLERKKDVYALYRDRIGESGFHKIWNGSTWKNVMMEVYTEENKQFHLHDTANKGSQNGNSKITEDDVKNIRIKRKNGEKAKNVYRYYSDKLTYGSFYNIWAYQNWKDIIV